MVRAETRRRGTTVNIEELRSLEAAATPAPWALRESNPPNPARIGIVNFEAAPTTIYVADNPSIVYAEPWGSNAALIVALRNAAPALLQLLEDAQKLLVFLATFGDATDPVTVEVAALLARFEEVR